MYKKRKENDCFEMKNCINDRNNNAHASLSGRCFF